MDSLQMWTRDSSFLTRRRTVSPTIPIVHFSKLTKLVQANFIAFLKHIDVPVVKTQMTFGVSRDAGDFEWAGTSLSGVFAQRGNLFKPRMWRLLFDIVRFNQFALDLLKEEENDTDPMRASNNGTHPQPQEESIGEYLNREGYSQTFRDDYLIPMTAAVWSTSPDKASLHFPAITLVRFMWNHHLLSTIAARPDWMTISGGSQQYIDAVMKDFPQDRVHLRTKVTSLRPSSNGHMTLSTNTGEESFDHVILATHGDQALEIMDQAATSEERKILSGFKTNRFEAAQYLQNEQECCHSAFRSLIHAKATCSMVCLELHHRITLSALHFYQECLESVSHILDEPPSTHSREAIW
jgi:predicted NAD/FAD-binding protein